MASGRFLSTSIAEDDRLSKLSLMAEFIYLKTIPHLDRDGMISGKPGLLYSRVCPTREEMFGNVQSLIDEWVKVGLVIRFDSAEGPVLFFPGFLKNNNLPHYDRERASRFPSPPGYERVATGLILEGTEPPVKKQKSRTESNESTAKVQDEVLESVQDVERDEVLENELQEQEQEQEEDKEQDQEQLQDEDDTPAPVDESVAAKWLACYGKEVPKNVRGPINELVAKCGPEAVIHGIEVTAKNKSHNFLYIAKSARNYVPAPQNANYTNGYHVEGVYKLEPAERSTPPPELPAPMAHDDPWAQALAELMPTLPGKSGSWLEGSQLVEDGELAGVPLYRVMVLTEPGNIGWLTQQAEPAVRKKLSSILRKRIMVNFVAASVPTIHGATA